MAAARGGLPVGFVFSPSKEELVGYFLNAKLSGKTLSAADYPQLLDCDVYCDHPRNLFRATRNRRGVQEGEDDKSGYFFTSLKKATANGTNISRCIKDVGTWLEKAGTKHVYDENMNIIGKDKYYKFTPVVESENGPLNEFDWQMHEYTHLLNPDLALCHITKSKKSKKSKKRSQSNAILESVSEARACKQSRVDYGSSECLPSIINPTQHASHEVNNYDLQQQFTTMAHGSDYGFEPTTDDAFTAMTTEEIVNMISFDEKNDGDVCEVSDPYVAEGGLFDEYGRVTNVLHPSSSESMNDNPEQHTVTVVEATTDDALPEEILNLMSPDEENDTDVCEVIDPYAGEGGQCHEYDRVTTHMHSSSSECMNYPEQQTETGVEATTDEVLTEECSNYLNLTTIEPQIVEEEEECIGQGTSISAKNSSSEFKEEQQVPQEDIQLYENQEQAFLLPQSCTRQYNYLEPSTSYDYSNIVGPDDPFLLDDVYSDFTWSPDIFAY